MKKKIEKQIKKHLSGITLFFAFLFLALGAVSGFLGYKFLNKDGNTTIELKGDEIVFVFLGNEYQEEGYNFIIDDHNYNDLVEVSGNVDTNRKGTYVLIYTLKNEQFDIVITRVVNVIGGVSDGN